MTLYGLQGESIHKFFQPFGYGGIRVRSEYGFNPLSHSRDQERDHGVPLAGTALHGLGPHSGSGQQHDSRCSSRLSIPVTVCFRAL